MRFSYFIFPKLLISLSFLPACSETNYSPPSETSSLAQVELGELSGVDYERLELSIKNLDESNFVVDSKSYKRGEGSISLSLIPGNYRVLLNYFQADELLFSSGLCSGDLYNADIALKSGLNRVNINICQKSEDGAELEINPILVGTTPEAAQQDQQQVQLGQDEVFGKFVDRSESWYIESGEIYRAGERVELKGINWFGLDSPYHGLHGLWSGRSMDSFLDQIKSLGFNSIRVPLSPESLSESTAGQDGYTNPVAQIKDLIKKAESKDIYILLDYHTCSSEVGYLASSPLACSGYTLNDWFEDLRKMASLAKASDTVVGIDLFNEPHEPTWQQWSEWASQAAKVVLSENPNILTFVEGVADSSSYGEYAPFWGENLYEAHDKRPNIPLSRLVYSPHAYGPSVYDGHDYFQQAAFPNNMPAVWESHFGFLKDKGYVLAVGEFGGRLEGKDLLWQEAFVKYLVDKNIDHFFYWSLNPNSGDTGGILKDDWISVDNRKLEALKPLLR